MLLFFRAVYADADIYLLDDPLSAVDAEVGRHLFEKCICGILEKKARILVTHQLQFLKSVGQIILLSNGKVQAQGSYGDLLATGIDFAQLLQSEDDKEDTPSVSGSSPTKRSSFGRPRTTSEASVNSYISQTHQRKGSLTLSAGEGTLTGTYNS